MIAGSRVDFMQQIGPHWRQGVMKMLADVPYEWSLQTGMCVNLNWGQNTSTQRILPPLSHLPPLPGWVGEGLKTENVMYTQYVF